ncbi:MAG: TIGR04086 family membrane protein [Gallintestinimicrobium sp.]
MGHEEMQSTVCRLAGGMQQEACPWKKENGISQTGARMPVVLLKSLLVSYLMAGALLLLLALLLYRMQLSAQAVSIGILVIYAVTAGLSGWLAGKGMRDRRFYGDFDRSLYFVC